MQSENLETQKLKDEIEKVKQAAMKIGKAMYSGQSSSQQNTENTESNANEEEKEKEEKSKWIK